MHGGAQRTALGHFGLLVGEAWDLRHIGLLGKLMGHAATVREALQYGAVYHHLNSQGGWSSCATMAR
jgi:Arabinose-binding domain of AraC transcription regulator, N-term